MKNLILMCVAAILALACIFGVSRATGSLGGNGNAVACADYSQWLRNPSQSGLIDQAIAAQPSDNSLYADLESLRGSIAADGAYGSVEYFPMDMAVASDSVSGDCSQPGNG